LSGISLKAAPSSPYLGAAVFMMPSF
jgi:hypothetical protein